MSILKTLIASATLASAVLAHPHNGDQLTKRALPFGSILTSCTVPGTVALTFDDGPSTYTAELLDKLEARGHRVTFYQNGANYGPIASYASLLKRMITNHHQIASHTYTHADLATLSYDGVVSEMTQMETAYMSVLGFMPYYMRPPYLSTSPTALQALLDLKYVVVQIDIDTQDWQNTSPTTIHYSLTNYTEQFNEGGRLSLSHDPLVNTVQTLIPNILDFLDTKGLKSVTTGECMGDPVQNWYRTTRDNTFNPYASVSSSVVSSSTRASSSSRPASSSSRPASSSSSRPASSSAVPTSSRASSAVASSSAAVSSSRASSAAASSSQASSAAAASSRASSAAASSPAVSSPAGRSSSSSAPTASSPAAGSSRASSAPAVSSPAAGRSSSSSGPAASSPAAGSSRASSAPAASSPAAASSRPASSVPATPSSSKAATPSGVVSPDGSCGGSKGYTCGSGQCCSQYGWCGVSSDYCGTGCQSSFGGCSSGSGGSTGPTVESPDWTCGGMSGYKCPGSNCCSQYGWCGTGSDYCGTGCQNGFGRCY